MKPPELRLADLFDAARQSPDDPAAHHQLGVALLSAGRRIEAVRALENAAALAPLNSGILHDFGRALIDAGSYGAAAAALRHALRLENGSAVIHNSFGLALLALGEYAEAADAFDHALRLEPSFAAAMNNLGTTYKDRGRLDEAIGYYELAILLDPANPSTHWNLSLVLLQKGDYERGWREYEWRLRRPSSPPRVMPRPLWDGAPLSGQTVFLYGEQGLGDTLQFCRYAALVKNAGAGKVLLESPSPIAKILASCPAVDELVVRSDSPDGALPRFDLHLPLMSAPNRFGTTLQKLPARIPYLSPEPERIAFWRTKMTEQGYRVGLCWQGNPHHPLDRFRSAPLAALKPLATIPDVRLFSLQRGPGSEQIDEIANREMNIREMTSRTVDTAGDWADTAAIMANLDLVITVDTATAHLAGALGVKTWVALASSPDWRWLLDREDTPWYPTLRLFRQDRQQPGAWSVVFDRMAAKLTPIRQ